MEKSDNDRNMRVKAIYHQILDSLQPKKKSDIMSQTITALNFLERTYIENMEKEEIDKHTGVSLMHDEQALSFIDLFRDTDIERDPLGYHKKRVDIVDDLTDRYVKDPDKLKTTLKEAYSPSFLVNSGVRCLITNLVEVYEKVSRNILGGGKYILSIDDDGKIFPKNLPSNMDPDVFMSNWKYLTYHAAIFSMFDPKALSKNVLDGERWSDFTHDDNYPVIEKGFEISSSLINFGIDNKHFYSDMPHEIVLNAGNIYSITILDNHPHISYKVKHTDGSILVGEITRFDEQSYLYQTDEMGRKMRSLKQPERTGSILALVGAGARDMFVLEERNTNYDIRARKKRNMVGGSKKKKKTTGYIWLPRTRINYIGESDKPMEDRIFQISPVHVSGSHVSGHRRKCNNPNPVQVELARKYGIVLPSGYTFVRPHDRGEYEKEMKKYKSRSAIKTLFGEYE